MKNFLIQQICLLLSNKLTNLVNLRKHLHSFTYKELNNIADCLVSDCQVDHERAENMIAARIAMDVLANNIIA